MSLINDALKQAKATQPPAATANGPALRPDFSPGHGRAGNDFLLPALVVVILALAALLLWQWFRSGHGATIVHAQTIEAQPAPAPTPTVAPTPPVASTQVVAPAPQPVIAATTPPPAATNVQPAVVVAPQPVVPPPPAFRLQSIFYRAKNPSAVINGKTLFVGDRIGTAHVTAIARDSVTILTASGETKILELSE